MQIELDGKKISIDTRLKGDINLVSHAHSDHNYAFYTNADPIVASSKTLDLSIARRKFNMNNRVIKEECSELTITSLNSGHILGSKQFLIHDHKNILYAGEILLDSSIIGEKIEFPNEEIDEVYVDSLFYKFAVSFPSREEIYSTTEHLVSNLLMQGKTVIFSVYEMGKAQEVTKLLNSMGIIPKVTPNISKINDVYTNYGKNLQYTYEESEVLVFDRASAESERRKRKNSFLITLSGWAVIRDFNSDAQLPLSDHADYRQTKEFLDIIEPKKVIFI